MSALRKITWQKKIHLLAGQEDGGFFVCKAVVEHQWSSKPMLVIIHQGDAIETADGFGSRAEAKSVVDLAIKNTTGMSSEILGAMSTHDVVVLS